jgi:two-component system response regulator AtoC
MQAVLDKLERAARTSVPILIQGESGTGKEIIATLVHAWSPYANQPFVRVNCPAIPNTLIETELFGNEKGAFTGAYASKPGRVELAHKGTLFLDEIGDLDVTVQAKLLHLLQDGTFVRVGGESPRQVQIRLVSATHKDLGESTRSATFRLDLYYRINAIILELLPLRRRRADIPLLADYLLATYSARFRVARPVLSTHILNLMQRYSWPGNIRQLENVIRAYVILGSEDAIISEISGATATLNEIQFDESSSLRSITKQATRDLEQRIILKVLQANNWNRRKTAKSLKISYRSLLYKLRDLGAADPNVTEAFHASPAQ